MSDDYKSLIKRLNECEVELFHVSHAEVNVKLGSYLPEGKKENSQLINPKTYNFYKLETEIFRLEKILTELKKIRDEMKEQGFDK